MTYDKPSLRKKFLLQRKKKYISIKKFNFKLIFKLIKKHFNNKKITIAGYYPSDNEVNVLKFLEESSQQKFKIALPLVKSKKTMCFKIWNLKEPLYVSKFGILEPNKFNKEIIPDLVLLPLVAFDDNLNRIGYGKGYYDRILPKISKVKKNIICLGVAYSFQKCPRIPTNKYDFKLDYIFTEQGIINSN